jgi:hypothetical protein
VSYKEQPISIFPLLQFVSNSCHNFLVLNNLVKTLLVLEDYRANSPLLAFVNIQILIHNLQFEILAIHRMFQKCIHNLFNCFLKSKAGRC